MATNLVDIIKGYITPDVVSHASSALGESENSINKAITTSIPVVLSGLVQKSEDSNVMNSVMGFSKEIGRNADNVLTNPRSMFATNGAPSVSGIGTKLVQLLFGNRQTSVNDTIARESGIKASSASSILGMIGTLVVSYIGKSGTSVNDLKSLLSFQKDKIMSGIPEGMNFISDRPAARDRDYSRHSNSERTNPVHSGNKTVDDVANKTVSNANWVWPVLIALAVILGVYYFTRTPDRDASENRVATNTERHDRPYASTATDRNQGPNTSNTMGSNDRSIESSSSAMGNSTAITLPNGKMINASGSGLEYKLNRWLSDKSTMVDKTTWFNFDRLSFQNGRATVLPESREQLENVATILKAYPNVKLKIGGYTDNVGNAAANMKLSDQRAKAVKNELVKMGIASSRVEAEGYGSQFPAGSNDTAEGKSQNRRIAIRVTQK